MLYIKPNEDVLNEALSNYEVEISFDQSETILELNDIVEDDKKIKVHVCPDIMKTSGHGARVKVIEIGGKRQTHTFPIDNEGTVIYDSELNKEDQSLGRALAKTVSALIQDDELFEAIKDYSGRRGKNNKLIPADTSTTVRDRIKSGIDRYNRLSKTEKRKLKKEGKVYYK